MHGSDLIADFAIVLVVASVTGLVFRALRQPTVLGYLFAGLIVGPYIPIPVFADPERTHALSELGVVLVMFVVGLELRIKRLVEVLPTAGATALIEVAALFGAGFGVARALGWDPKAAIFLGASVAISSTMVVSKVFEESDVSDDIRDHVMSVLVLQDVLAIVLATILTALAAGQELSAEEIGSVVGQLVAVLAGVLIVGMLIVPRVVRIVAETESDELLTVIAVGLCFALAYGAHALRYSVALGAFFAGMLVAESGIGHRIEHLVQPLRDVFAAIFFVAIGMSVDPRLAFDHIGVSLLVFVVVVSAQLLSVSISGVLSGMGLRRSVTSGLALGQVGEFGFILAAIGTSASLAPPSLAPIIVTVAVLTAFTTPMALRGAPAVIRAIDHALPHRVQDVLSVYESWFAHMRKAKNESSLRRAILVLVLEGAAIAGIVLATSLGFAKLVRYARDHGIPERWSSIVVWVVAVIVALIPFVGFLRASRALGAELATRVFHGESPRLRRMMVVGVQLLVLLAIGLPFAVALAPVVGPWLFEGLAIATLVLGSMLWRRAGESVPIIRSSAEKLVDVVGRARGTAPVRAADDSWLDEVEPFTLTKGAAAIGQTLAGLDLRAKTGATVIAIRRGEDHRRPTGNEHLEEGDVLAVCGDESSLALAKELLG